MIKKRIAVFTWNNKLVMLVRGRVLLQQLVGPYYIGRIGYGGLLNLDYCIHFERLSGFKDKGGKRIVYTLLKKHYASSAIRSRIRSMKRGILDALTKGMSLRILLRQLPKTGAVNLPLHRYDYKLVAICLLNSNKKILDIDSRCRDTPF